MDERIESKEEKLRRNARRVPYAHMMWAPLERRLDMAVFRALFASSVRQARQFVLHGWVHVNGKKVGITEFTFLWLWENQFANREVGACVV